MSRLIADWRDRKGQEDEGLHEKLRIGLEVGRIQLYTDARMIDFDGSPVHCHWDHLLPLTGLMSLALVILLAGGLALGIVAMTLFVMVYLLGNRTYVSWRLRRRTVAYLCRDVAHVQALWRLGGIALVVPGTGEPPCVAPKGDWRKFIRRHFGEAVPTPDWIPLVPVSPVTTPPAAPEVEPLPQTVQPPPPPPPPPPSPSEPVIEMAPPRAAPPPSPADMAEPAGYESPKPGTRWDSILDDEKPPRDEVVP